jgi:hypothetical protein
MYLAPDVQTDHLYLNTLKINEPTSRTLKLLTLPDINNFVQQPAINRYLSAVYTPLATTNNCS